jgi:hypothetical protein
MKTNGAASSPLGADTYEAVWQTIDNNDVPWGITPSVANVGLLASANDKLGGVSMVELPLRRRMRSADEKGRAPGASTCGLRGGAGRCIAEAKQA